MFSLMETVTVGESCLAVPAYQRLAVFYYERVIAECT